MGAHWERKELFISFLVYFPSGLVTLSSFSFRNIVIQVYILIKSGFGVRKPFRSLERENVWADIPLALWLAQGPHISVPCKSSQAQHPVPGCCRHVWVPCEAGLLEEAGRLEQGCGHSCPAQTKEEQEGEDAATGARCSGL